MKKLFLVVTMLVFSVSAFAAGTLGIGAKKFAVEALPAYSDGVVLKDNVSYEGPDNVSAGNIVAFTLTNAKWKDDTYQLKQGSTVVADAYALDDNDRTLKFEVSTEFDNSTKVNIKTTNTNADNGTIILDSGVSAGDNVTISAEVYTSLNGLKRGSFSATAVPVIAVIDAYTLSIESGSDTIDVHEGRLLFDNGDNKSSGNVLVTAKSVIDYDVKGTTSLEIAVTPENADGIAYVNFAGNTDSDNVSELIDGSYVFSVSNYTLPTTGNNDNFTITVYGDGETPLVTQNISSKITVDFDDSENQGENSLSGTLLTWDINGAQFSVPYMIRSDDQFIRINNSYSQPAAVDVDLYDEAGNKVNSVSIGEVAPYGAKVFKSASDIAAKGIAAGWTPASYGYTAVFTIAAPEQNVDAVSVQRSSTGSDRVIPLTKYDTAK